MGILQQKSGCKYSRSEGPIILSLKARLKSLNGQEVLAHKHQKGHICVDQPDECTMEQLIEAVQEIGAMCYSAAESFAEQVQELEAQIQYEEKPSRGSARRYQGYQGSR